jgi:glycerol-3-phosphate acyltransferase PlsY
VASALIVFVLSYLLGSIPWGLLLGKLAGHDIRQEGSRNIGATNLWRVCGWKLGLTGFVLDFAKGLAAVLAIGGMAATILPYPYHGILAAVGAVLGHNFPVWLRFRGGKGVATSAGAVAGLMPLPFAVAIASFIITVAVSRYISLGSMLASVVLVIACLLLLPEPFGANLPLLVLTVLLSAMLLFRHRQNFARILNGTENRFPPPKPPADN